MAAAAASAAAVCGVALPTLSYCEAVVATACQRRLWVRDREECKRQRTALLLLLAAAAAAAGRLSGGGGDRYRPRHGSR